MKVKKRGLEHRRARAEKLWLKWKKDYDGGMSVMDIAKKYKRYRKNKKPYARQYIYEAFKQLEGEKE